MRHWTLEERQKQAELIRQWEPWRASTGAKTANGKDTSKMNAYRHGMRCAEVRNIERTITESKKILTNLNRIF